MEPECTMSEGAAADTEMVILGETLGAVSDGADATGELIELGTISAELSIP